MTERAERPERFIQRLECEFTSGDVAHRSISSDLSETGLFIRTRHGLAPGSAIDITLYLPNGSVSKLKGIVRRTIKTDFSGIKNGMGIEIIEKDDAYLEFIGSKVSGSNYVYIRCSFCGTKNKIPRAKLSLGPKCGVCKAALKI